MAAITFGPGMTYAGAQRVYVRQFWADAWSLNQDLTIERLVWSLWPSTPVAEFTFRYGPTLRRGSSSWINLAKPELRGWYVRAEVDTSDGSLLWVGFIDDVADYQGGITDGIASGRLALVAYGMSHALAFERLLGSYWWDSAATTTRLSGSAVPFNADGRPNRTQTKPSGQPSHYFERDESVAAFWTSADIAEYLIANHTPRNQAGSAAIAWDLNANSLLPTWDRPEIVTDGASVAELLQTLIDRRLFLGAWDGFNVGTNRNSINVVSLSDVTADLTNGRTLVAAATQHSITCSGDHATNATVQTTVSSVFSQVVARGARRTSTATIKVGDTLARSWTTAEKNAYNAGASADPNYTSADSYTRRKMNLAARSAPELAHVYRTLEIPVADDLTVGGQLIFRNDDTPATRHYAFFRSIAILPELPFWTNVDYSADAIANGPNLASALFLFRPLLAWLKRPVVEPVADRFARLESIGETGLLGGVNDDAWFSVEPLIGGDLRSIELAVDGAPQFAIAGSEWTPLADDTLPASKWDLGTFEATVCFLDDRYTEARAPATLSGTIDAVRRVVLDLGDAFRRDYVLPGTVVSIDENGAKLTTTGGGHVRDDRSALESVANLAALWYTRPRSILRLTSSRPTAALRVGDLVTTLNPSTPHAATINTTISEIVLVLGDSENDKPPVPRFDLVTAATQFDPLGFLPETPPDAAF